MNKYSTLFFLLWSTASFGQGWSLEREETDLKVYSRLRDNGLKELKTVAIINASARRLKQFILDYENSDWKHNVSKAYAIEESENKGLVVYYLLDIPWPFKDRDFYARVRIEEDSISKEIQLAFTPLPDYRPEEPGLVRITDFSTLWVIRPIDSNSSELQLISYADPAGIPFQIVNFFAVETPFKSIKNLKTRIETHD